MTRQVSHMRWMRLFTGTLLATGVVVGTAVGQSSSSRNDQSDRSDRSVRTEQRSKQQNRDQSDRLPRNQNDQTQSDQEHGTPWLGVFLGRPTGQENQPGAVVERVFPNSPAAKAGLEAGDIVTAINGARITSPDDLVSAVEDENPGTRMKFTVLRDDEQKSFPVVLGNRQNMAFYEQNPGNWEERFGGQPYGQFSPERVPPFAMQLEHDRRTYEQHERIENEITKLREEVRSLRDMLKQQLQQQRQ